MIPAWRACGRPQVRPGVYDGAWTHASLLRTLEDGFGLAHLADAGTVSAIDSIWK